MHLIGRLEEQKQLDRLLESRKAEFLAVIGRRRVGKTFLIRTYLGSHFCFHHTGLANASTEAQVENFHNSLIRQTPNYNASVPKGWLQAFQHLIDYLDQLDQEKKKVIFLDELPWMDTPRSNFLSALEHLWNSYLSARKDIILIACGSAASWIIENLIRNTGGLYNRVTQRMKIYPFNLNETEAFLQYKNVKLSRYQILQIYMVMGGIPFYLDQVLPECSAAQNIDAIAFSRNGLLRKEFPTLISSLFKKAKNHLLILKALSTKAKGMTRKEIVKITKLSSGGGFSSILEELEESGFITSYSPFKNKAKDTLYRLSDFYTMFYFRFLASERKYDQGYWLNALDLPAHRAWSGFTFEQVCMEHLPQIKKAIGISGVQTQSSSWTGRGAQIDLLIDRRDLIITICEAKFSINEYQITSSYANNLRNKIGALRQESSSKKAIHLALITTYGLTNQSKYGDLVQQSIVMDDLFAII